MRKNKEFVRNVIILSVVGLVILMITLFVVLQAYLSKETTTSTYIKEEPEIEKKVEVNETFNILVDSITANHIIGYDIQNQKPFSKVLEKTVKINDAYGKILPIDQIKSGDIIEVDYQSSNDRITLIRKSSSVHSWNKISGVTVNTDIKQINIAGTYYTYTDEIMVINQNRVGDINQVGPYDIVSIQALDNKIWSITIEEASASLNLIDLPTSDGQIEIDNSRLIMLADVKEPILLTPGTHKIVIKMQGYETIVEKGLKITPNSNMIEVHMQGDQPISEQEFVLESGEAYALSLKDAQIAYRIVKPYIASQVTNYTITIDDKTYLPGEEIKLQQGKYKVEINAEGYEKFITQINLEGVKINEVYPLKPALVAIVEEEIPEGSTEVADGTLDSSQTNAVANNTRTITINTDPTGASIYIDGAYKGDTPYTVTLSNGSHNILIQKADYEIYTTTIMLDGSNDQSSFLYNLTASNSSNSSNSNNLSSSSN